MGTKFFEKYPEYEIVEKPSVEVINKYKNMLPDSFIDFWKEYGFGIFMDGFIKFVNPDDYQEILDYAYDNTEDGIVFAITGLGDFFLWENDENGGAIRLVNFRYGDEHIVGVKDNIDWFFEKNLASDFYTTKFFKEKNYFLARERYGEPLFDECFGYVPLLGMGGPEKVENMEKVKIIEHIYLITEMMGKIED